MFSCAIGSDVASVCAGGSGRDRLIQYRFGAMGTPTVLAPSTPGRASTIARGETFAYSGGGGSSLHIEDRGVGYSVTSSMIRGDNGRPSAEEFVSVGRSGQEKVLNCTKPAQGELGPEFFETAGIPLSDG